MARQQQYQGQGGMVDPIAARQKEEQRRRQQAYAQALAHQVQQRELQKQRDRDIERQGTSHGRQPHQGSHDPGGDAVGKGLFDGFGEKGNQNRTNFARGQRQQPQPQTQYQEQPQQISPMRFGNAPQGFQPELHYNSNKGFQPPQQQQQHYGGGNGFNPDFGHQGHGNPQLFAQPQAGLSDWGAPLQPQHFGFHSDEQHNGHLPQQQYQQEERIGHHFDQHQQHFHQQPQYQELPSQQPQQQHTRGLRSDPSSASFGAPGVPGSGGGGEDDNKVRRKLQQQMEIQSALQKQVEEKNRLKLEAKRRQEEEDRREVERFEAEQQRLKQEEDRIKDEKRKKAEEDLVRAQQAAAALADHQKKAQHHLQSQQQQQQVYQQQQQQQQVSPQRTMHNQQASPTHQLQQHQPHHRKSPQKLNPFANTRAHLFEDPPIVSPQRRMMQNAINQFNSYADDDQSLVNTGHRNKGFQPQTQHQDPEDENEQEMPVLHPMHRQPESFPKFQHRNELVAAEHSQWPPPQPQFVDPTVLLRQYDEMKQELMRQRQIVDQLREAHAQIQLQQQQQQLGSLSPNGSTPTLSDLEHLRNELREELLQREQLHRQELEKFRRQQEQLRSVNQQHGSSSHKTQRSTTSRFEPKDGNQHSPSSYLTNNNDAGAKRPGLGVSSRNLNHSTSGNSLREQFRGSESEERELGSTSLQAVINTSRQQQQLMMIPTASLQCDSKMVYFDGQVHQEEPRRQSKDQRPEAQAPPSPPALRKPAMGPPELILDLEDSMDQLVLQLDLARSGVDSKQRAAVVKSKQVHEHDVNNQDDSGVNRKEHHSQELNGDDDGEDALAFFIKDFREPKSSVSKQNHYRSPRQNRLEDAVQAKDFGRYSSPWMADDEEENEDFLGAASSRLRTRAQWPQTFEIDEHDEHDDDEELSGEELEAIFQRNVRRHEILLSFQPQRTNQSNSGSSQSQDLSTIAGCSMAWTQLHQQLEENVTATSLAARKEPPSRPHPHIQVTSKRLQREDSLIASSRWMPSAI